MNDISSFLGQPIEFDGKDKRQLYECEQSDFNNICFTLISHYKHIWLIDIISYQSENKIFLEYSFINLDSKLCFNIRFKKQNDVEVKSIVHFWRNASKIENELFDLAGIKFTRGYEREFFSDDSDFPLFDNLVDSTFIPKKKSNEKVDIVLNEHRSDILYHPMNINIDKDDLVSSCYIERGHYHCGMEKLLEEKNQSQFFYHIEDLFLKNHINWTFLAAKNVEDAMDINITDRAKAMRMVLLEFQRIIDHLTSLYKVARSIESSFISTESRRWLKSIQSVLMALSGNEFATHIIRPGGMTKDVNQIWLSRVQTELEHFEINLRKVYSTIIKSFEWESTLSVKLPPKKIAFQWSLSGPFARAMGLNLDFRKSHPFYFYKDVNFEVPVGVNSSAYDLLIVKIEEIFQSINIIIQVLDNLPTGLMMSKEMCSFYSFKEDNKDFDESEYIKSVQKSFETRNYNAYNMMESSNGILSLFTEYSNSKIKRVKFGSSMQSLLGVFEKDVVKKELSNVNKLWAIYDIDMKVVER